MPLFLGQPLSPSDLGAIDRLRAGLDSGMTQLAAWWPWMVLLGLSISIILWLAGSRAARGIHVVLQTGIWAFVGMVAGPVLLSGPWQGVEPMTLGAGAGCIAGLIVGLATRGLVIPALGVTTFATLAVLGAIVAMPMIDDTSAAALRASVPISSAPAKKDSFVIVRHADETPEQALARTKSNSSHATDDQPESSNTESTLAALREHIQSTWNALTGTGQTAVAASAVGGATFGLLLALLARRHAAAIITAFAGGAAVLLSAHSAATLWTPQYLTYFDQPAAKLLAAWGIAGAIGCGVQFLFAIPKKAKKVEKTE